MKPFFAFLHKEWLESIRSGKFFLLLLLFLFLGMMNPFIAKLTPWLMETMTSSMANTGLSIAEIQVTALTSWAQFFKNLPIALLVFTLLYSSSFTKEYQTESLLLIVTKGFARYKIVLAKICMMFLIWTICFSLCFGVTYAYNMYFWDNGIAKNLFLASVCFWVFGLWVISLITFFSTTLKTISGVILGTGGLILAAYLAGLFQTFASYTPAALLQGFQLVSGQNTPADCQSAIFVTLSLCTVAIVASIYSMNRRQL